MATPAPTASLAPRLAVATPAPAAHATAAETTPELATTPESPTSPPAPTTVEAVASVPVMAPPPPPPPPNPPRVLPIDPLAENPGATPAPAFVETTQDLPALPTAAPSTQPARYFPEPLAIQSPLPATPAPVGSAVPGEPFIHLDRHGQGVDVDSSFFPQDQDLFFQASIPAPPQPGENSSGSGIGASGRQVQGLPSELDSSINRKEDSSSKQESTSHEDLNQQSSNNQTTHATTHSLAQEERNETSNSLAREEFNRNDTSTQSIEYTQRMVWETPPPAPAASESIRVLRLYSVAQRLAYDNKYDLALMQLNKALELEPTNPSLYALQGSIYYREGVIDMARDSWTRALIYDPAMSDVRS
ncbi:MAG: hypothetical protein KGR26_14880, partial [Cyanobacteria bacterium REEB65]|nr:hypothetical protein [Cyanobacteria bacterium REEB65]